MASPGCRGDCVGPGRGLKALQQERTTVSSAGFPACPSYNIRQCSVEGFMSQVLTGNF